MELEGSLTSSLLFAREINKLSNERRVNEMIKFTQGSVTNHVDGVTKDIIVKAATPNTLKDSFIGYGLVLMGLTYLTVTAFKNGSNKFEEAELQAMFEAGILGVDDGTFVEKH